MKKKVFGSLAVLGLSVGLLFPSLHAEAHCDTTQGPTYHAFELALEEDNFKHISYWVAAEDEAELQEIFELSREVLNNNDDEASKELAERYLFENFVRIHRASEGAPYTGISEEPIDPGVAAADQSIAEESLVPLEEAGFINDENRAHVEEVFADLLATKDFDVEDTEAGRAYVENYVTFTHLFEAGHTDHENEDHEEEHDKAQDEHDGEDHE